MLVGDETRDIASSHGLDDHCAAIPDGSHKR
jgi:hypothetical protein